MDWQSIQSNWYEYKANARGRWSRLTREEVERIGGDRDQLVAKIRERYGLAAEEAEKQLGEWQQALRKVNPFR